MPAGAKAPSHDIPESLVAAFYVNWDDNSFASFQAHASAIDWLICEWAFLAPSGDSLRLRLDNRVLYTVQRMPEAERPRLFVMVSNFDVPRPACRLGKARAQSYGGAARRPRRLRAGAGA
jgi:hypothetical protein